MIKLIAFDLDDTCLNWNNRLTPVTLAALKKAAASGVEIVFATGRSYEALPYQLKEETFFRYVIASNGACIVDRHTGEVIYQSYIPADTAMTILKEAKERGLGITVHEDRRHVVEGRKLLLLGRFLYGRDSKTILCVRNMSQYIREKQDKIEEIHLFFFRKNKRKKAEDLRREFPSLHIPMSRFCAELVTKSTTKGSALEWLYRQLGLCQMEVACVGDGENDIPMFEKSGLRFAVNNAKSRLKALAHFVVPNNSKNGVRVAIENVLRINAIK